MILRKRHIKTKLKRRRRGQKELSFVEFREQLGESELKKLEREAVSADMLRKGYYDIRNGRLFSGIRTIIGSALMNPSYFVSKFKHNFLKFK